MSGSTQLSIIRPKRRCLRWKKPFFHECIQSVNHGRLCKNQETEGPYESFTFVEFLSNSSRPETRSWARSRLRKSERLQCAFHLTINFETRGYNSQNHLSFSQICLFLRRLYLQAFMEFLESVNFYRNSVVIFNLQPIACLVLSE